VYSNGALGFGNIDVSSNIGHMIIDFKGDRCICGKYGCLETYASINSIYKRLKRIVETVPQLSEAEQQQCYNDIWNCCPELLQVRHIIEQNGEKVAAYLEELEQAFTSALINFVYLFNANIIYYGGRTVEQLSTPIQKAFNNVMDDSSSQFYRDLQFRKSDISEKLLIRGASYHVINKYVHLIR
jgi:predicted NBD/HSP70 family sugar kinase